MNREAEYWKITTSGPHLFRPGIGLESIFHQSAYDDLGKDLPKLSISTILSGSAHIRIQSGYPEIFGGSSKHLQVDNLPATLSSDDVTGLDVNVGHYTHLLLCTPDHKITYIVTIIAPAQYNDKRNQAMIRQNDREMQAILSSIHLEKAEPSTHVGL